MPDLMLILHNFCLTIMKHAWLHADTSRSWHYVDVQTVRLDKDLVSCLDLHKNCECTEDLDTTVTCSPCLDQCHVAAIVHCPTYSILSISDLCLELPPECRPVPCKAVKTASCGCRQQAALAVGHCLLTDNKHALVSQVTPQVALP